MCGSTNKESGRCNGVDLVQWQPGMELTCNYKRWVYHPVHLSDCLGDRGQYKVLNKLGHGYSTVWLCRVLDAEPTQYVAVKILTAEQLHTNREKEISKRIQQAAQEDSILVDYCGVLLDQFEIDGPNGIHACFVYPVGGPSINDLFTVVEEPEQYFREVARQAVEVIGALHRHGICHGNLCPENFLLSLDGLNGIPEDQLRNNLLGHPTKVNVVVCEGYSPGPSAPKYLVVDIKELYYCSSATDPLRPKNLRLVGFGSAFTVSDPKNYSDIPVAYAAPELLLEDKCGVASDMWALACMIFYIRMGEHLFPSWPGDTDLALATLVDHLGRLPDLLWAAWENRAEYCEDELDANGNVIWADDITGANDPPSTIRERLEKDQHGGVMRQDGKERSRHLSEQEMDLLSDLLHMMLKYDLNERPTAEQVLQHPWFSFGL
ncbi:kinase-like domain-containing protein [Aspergillus californicus]